MEGYGGGGDSSLGSPTSEMNTAGRSSNFGYEGTYSSSNPRAGANPNPGLVTNEPPISTGKMVRQHTHSRSKRGSCRRNEIDRRSNERISTLMRELSLWR